MVITLVVDVPLNARQAALIKRGELFKEVTREVDRVIVASHALVDDGTVGSDTVVGDGDGLATVSIGDDALREGQDIFGCAVVGCSTGAWVGGSGGSVVVSSVTGARRSLGTGTVGASILKVGGSGSTENCEDSTGESKRLEDGGHCEGGN